MGWLLLKGRCYDCAKPISPRYPAMEASFGLLALALVMNLGIRPETMALLAFVLLLLLIAWVDWETMYVFDVTTVPLAAIGFSMPWVSGGHYASPFDPAVSALSMLALMLLISALGGAWYQREVIGGGDLKLMAAGAAFLGCAQAWKGLAIGVLAALPMLLIYIKAKGLGRRDPAPFGPGLAFGLAFTACNMIGHGLFDPALDRVGLSMLKAY